MEKRDTPDADAAMHGVQHGCHSTTVAGDWRRAVRLCPAGAPGPDRGGAPTRVVGGRKRGLTRPTHW